MNKFEVGDKVIVVDDTGTCLRIGQVRVIAEVLVGSCVRLINPITGRVSPSIWRRDRFDYFVRNRSVLITDGKINVLTMDEFKTGNDHQTKLDARGVSHPMTISDMASSDIGATSLTSKLEIKNGGSTPSQYGIPQDSKDLQDLIEYREMSFSIGNIFKACYRLGFKNNRMYELQKMLWFINRLINQEKKNINTK